MRVIIVLAICIAVLMPFVYGKFSKPSNIKQMAQQINALCHEKDKLSSELISCQSQLHLCQKQLRDAQVKLENERYEADARDTQAQSMLSQLGEKYNLLQKKHAELMVHQSAKSEHIFTREELLHELQYLTFRDYLQRDEFDSLPAVKSHQIALDRYYKRKKSAWEVGVEYERYIGYCYEMKQYNVEYTGALQGKCDRGRDLIARKGDKTLIIQCKRWSKNSQVHMTTITDFHGAVDYLKRLHPDQKIFGVFVTTTVLAADAKQCADHLGIELHEKLPFKLYPLIKCIHSECGDSYYYLPFDIQYDAIPFDAAKGDKYVQTVAEAISSGFTRNPI